EPIGSFLGQNFSVARFQNGTVEAVEAADEIGILGHRLPNPIFITSGGEARENLCEFGHGVRHCGKTTAIACHSKGRPSVSQETTNLLEISREEFMLWKSVARAIP